MTRAMLNNAFTQDFVYSLYIHPGLPWLPTQNDKEKVKLVLFFRGNDCLHKNVLKTYKESLGPSCTYISIYQK